MQGSDPRCPLAGVGPRVERVERVERVDRNTTQQERQPHAGAARPIRLGCGA